jgi:hypothetical protein
MFALRRLSILLVVALSAIGLSACGNSHDEDARVVHAETEGLYLDISGLKYQVQISRQLNASDPEDKSYLVGIPEAERRLAADEVWFGVFLRVQNTGEKAHLPAEQIQINDTQDEVFRPIPLASINSFAYRPTGPIAPKGLIPVPNSLASEGPVQGSLVLFKLTNQALDNRPLELSIKGREAPLQTGIVDLDV